MGRPKGDGGPAFPAGECYELKEGWRREPGMSLRDHFAGCALTGIVADWGDGPFDPPVFAARAYTIADAMIERRSRG